MEKIFIDPEGCGCTDCIVGESVPLDNVSPVQLLSIVSGFVTVVNRSSWKYLHVRMHGGIVSIDGSDTLEKLISFS